MWDLIILNRHHINYYVKPYSIKVNRKTKHGTFTKLKSEKRIFESLGKKNELCIKFKNKNKIF